MKVRICDICHSVLKAPNLFYAQIVFLKVMRFATQEVDLCDKCRDSLLDYLKQKADDQPCEEPQKKD